MLGKFKEQSPFKYKFTRSLSCFKAKVELSTFINEKQRVATLGFILRRCTLAIDSITSFLLVIFKIYCRSWFLLH